MAVAKAVIKFQVKKKFEQFPEVALEEGLCSKRLINELASQIVTVEIQEWNRWFVSATTNADDVWSRSL
jgi:hypothetical protein